MYYKYQLDRLYSLLQNDSGAQDGQFINLSILIAAMAKALKSTKGWGLTNLHGPDKSDYFVNMYEFQSDSILKKAFRLIMHWPINYSFEVYAFYVFMNVCP